MNDYEQQYCYMVCKKLHGSQLQDNQRNGLGWTPCPPLLIDGHTVERMAQISNYVMSISTMTRNGAPTLKTLAQK
jgi:hypothetical protein